MLRGFKVFPRLNTIQSALIAIGFFVSSENNIDPFASLREPACPLTFRLFFF